jgi:hypothetical protein
MRPTHRVRISLLVLVMLGSTVWLSDSATARIAAQTPAETGTPGITATPAASQETSPYLVGDALLLLPPGTPGVVDVIAVGAPVQKYFVPLVLRNNTEETIVLTRIHGTAEDAAGEPIGSGDVYSFMNPSVVAAGQVALAAIEFNSVEPLPPDASFAFEPEAESLATATVFRLDLEIVEATREEDRIVGLARNGTDQPLAGKISVLGICFDATGAIQGNYAGFADKLDLRPGETAPFEVPFEGTGPCEAFLVGAGGTKKL